MRHETDVARGDFDYPSIVGGSARDCVSWLASEILDSAPPATGVFPRHCNIGSGFDVYVHQVLAVAEPIMFGFAFDLVLHVQQFPLAAT